MLKKDNFFKNYFGNLSSYKKNLKKTKKTFNSFIVDLKNNKIPLLESYDKNYEFDFLKTTIKKFSSYKNIVIIGMGGSVLGTKSICSFLKRKIKKNVFFFDNLDRRLIAWRGQREPERKRQRPPLPRPPATAPFEKAVRTSLW